MITKVEASYFQRVFYNCFPLSKTTKLALGALGLLTAMYCIQSLIGRASKPLVKEVPFPDEIIDVLGGKEKVDLLPVIPALPTAWSPFNYASKVFKGIAEISTDDEVTRSQKYNNIVSIKPLRPSGISRGTDGWGYPFIRIEYTKKRTEMKTFKSSFVLIYSNMESKELVWYIHENRFSKEHERVKFIQSLFKNEHATHELRQ